MEIVKTFYLSALQGNIVLLREIHKCHSIDLNISDKDNTTALILASANNQYEMVRVLLEMGADPNLVRISGTGPLFFACQSGYTKIAELLIQYNARINQQNRRDYGTPLLVASQNGHTACVNLLLNHGANVNHQLKDGATALFLAAQGGHMYTVDTLIRAHADVNLFKNDLATPIYIASQMGHHKIVKMLINSGAEVDAAREDGSTSLFKAAQKGHRLVIEALLSGGASTGLLGNGETALHMAALFGRTRITHLLLVNGANPMMKNKDGLTSCDLAKEAQFSDLLSVLESFEEKVYLKSGRKPFTAPSSISLELFNDDSSQYSDSTSTTDQTSGTTSVVPHLSAPTPLFYKWPHNKLYSGFMPPSTEEELIAAINSMSIASTVLRDDIETEKEIEKFTPKKETDLSEDPLINLEKILVARHSNPEIRELEEFRKAFRISQGIDDKEESAIKNGFLNCDSMKPSRKPIYLKSPTSYRKINSTQSRISYYIPPNQPPPPLPIPPQIFASNYSDKLPILDQSTVLVGKRKMSQPNLRNYQYEK